MAKDFIEQQYRILEDDKLPPRFKLEVYYSLIQIKIENESLFDQLTLRKDLKNFLSTYIESCEISQFGYDTIDLSKIFDVVESLGDDDIKYNFYKFGYRKLIN